MYYIAQEHRLRVFENKVLGRLFGTKRAEVTGDWRKLHNEELHNLYSSSSIIRMIRRMRWTTCSTNGVEEECIYVDYWWECQNEDHKEDQEVGGRVILNWILVRYMEWYGLDRCGSE
jgi:hypothetical protein